MTIRPHTSASDEYEWPTVCSGPLHPSRERPRVSEFRSRSVDLPDNTASENKFSVEDRLSGMSVTWPDPDKRFPDFRYRTKYI
jgi:hypothetical protein